MDINNYLKSMEGSVKNVKEKTYKLENPGFKEEGLQKLENIPLGTNSIMKPAKNLGCKKEGQQKLGNIILAVNSDSIEKPAKNLGFQKEGQQKFENITLVTNLGSVDKQKYLFKMAASDDPEKQEDKSISERGRKFTMFDVKMILIGSTALMFSKITGRLNFLIFIGRIEKVCTT